MLSRNPWYAYVRDNLSKNLSDRKIIQKTNSDNQLYYLWALSVNLADNQLVMATDTYVLKSHHISFYQHKNDKNIFLSLGHYTAYFHDENQTNEYELHAYFNHDADFMHLAWNKKKVAQEDQISSMTNFVMSQVNDHLSTFRDQYQAYSEGLETKFRNKEALLTKMSENIESIKSEYLAEINNAIVLLNKLVDYKYSIYAPVLNIFNTYKDYLESKDVSEEKPADNNVKNITADSNIKTQTSKKNQKKKNSKVRAVLSLISSDEESEIKRLEGEVNDIKNPLSTRTADFVKWDKMIEDISWRSEEDCYIHDHAKKLKILLWQRRRNNMGRALLSEAIVRADLENSQLLNKYLHDVAGDLIKVAFIKFNWTILDYVLKHDPDIQINEFSVEDNLSPLEYCYRELTTSINDPFVKSLPLMVATLIMFGCPVTIKLDGWSLAHRVLSNFEHPWFSAFARNASKIDNQRTIDFLVKEIDDHLKLNQNLTQPRLDELMRLKSEFASMKGLLSSSHVIYQVICFGKDTTDNSKLQFTDEQKAILSTDRSVVFACFKYYQWVKKLSFMTNRGKSDDIKAGFINGTIVALFSKLSTCHASDEILAIVKLSTEQVEEQVENFYPLSWLSPEVKAIQNGTVKVIQPTTTASKTMKI